MSAHTCPVAGSLVATRIAPKSLSVSLRQGDIGSTQRDMMRQHDAHNEKGPGNAANVPGPPPSTWELS